MRQRQLGRKTTSDIDETAVLRYQENRICEKSAPKSIDEEVRFLLKLLGGAGVTPRTSIKEQRLLELSVHKRVGKAFDGGGECITREDGQRVLPSSYIHSLQAYL